MQAESQHDHSDLRRVIAQGEDANVEFKEGLGFDSTGASNPKIVHAILKTVAAFLNTNGGTILIGVADTGRVTGVERDYGFLGKKNADGFQLRLRDLFHSHLNPPPLSSITIMFESLPEGTVCRVDVKRSNQVVHVNQKEVYVRDGNTTRRLDGRELTDWVSQRTGRRRVQFLSITIVLISGLVFGYMVLRTAAALPTKPPRPGVEEPLRPCALPVPAPETLQAKLAYNEGCQKVRQLDYPAARTLFEKASKIEPQNPVISLALADTSSWLGNEERATQECKKAVELSIELAPEPRLWVTGRCYQIDYDFEKAIRTYQALWALSPNKLEYGLQLVSAQTDAEDGMGAMATVAKLRTMPRPVRDDPRIDLAEAQAAELLDDSRRQQAAAQAALKKSQSAQQRLLGAEAKRWLGMANEELGDRAEARAVFQDAKDTFSASGDRLGAALVQHELAEMLEEEGSVDEALLFYREIEGFYRKIGNTSFRAFALNDIGDVMASQGNINGAGSAYDQALEAATSVGDKSSQRTALQRKGDLRVWQGELRGAKELYQDAVAIARYTHEKADEGDALDSLASLLILEGDLASAAKICEEVRSINEAIGKRRTQTGSWRSPLDLLLAKGDVGEAETVAQSVVQEFVNDQFLLQKVTAEDLLARALLAQSKTARAQDVISVAIVDARRRKDTHARLTVGITSARVHAARGDASNAEKELVEILNEAQKIGLFDVYLDATLVLADVRMRQGEQDRARTLLTRIETDAEAHGFNLIAAQAATRMRR
jgi:tetratricopeptide (TPR) repeat protein